MRQAGVPPTVMTYAALVTAYGRAVKPKEAHRVMLRMVASDGLSPDVKCFTALVKAYSVAGDLEGAKAAFEV